MRGVWPLLVIAAGLALPWLGAWEFVKGHDRFKGEHPEEYPETSGMDAARAEPRMMFLPFGIIAGLILLLVGLVWLIWVLVS